MKKFIVVALALMLAIPAISYAGSATSRWDMTIGGYVKFDLSYATQTQGADWRVPGRASWNSGNQNIVDEYAATSWAAGETRLNFSVKGPDAWGAKSSAFVEGDFRGVAGSTMNYGTFTLRHAFFKLNWAETELLVGHTWQPWGLIPSFDMLSFSENHFMKGATRTPQIRVTQKFMKDFAFKVAIAAPWQTLHAQSGANFTARTATGVISNEIDRARAILPDSSLEFTWGTDKCGKIGPWKLMFGLAGMIGKEKVTYRNPSAAVTLAYKDKDVDKWGTSFWGYVPIIPEKKGNKQYALGLTGNFFAGQGLGDMLPAYPGSGIASGVYNQGNTASVLGNGTATSVVSNTGVFQPVYPFTFGAWTQLTFYWTNNVYTNVLYGFQQNKYSDVYMFNNINNIRVLQNYVANIMYDVNPAIKLGFEYTYITAGFASKAAFGAAPATDSKGSMHGFRVGAYYFF